MPIAKDNKNGIFQLNVFIFLRIVAKCALTLSWARTQIISGYWLGFHIICRSAAGGAKVLSTEIFF